MSDGFWRIASEARSQTKTKRACDRCARAKAKCDYQVPCSRCNRKSLKCEKTRKGYEDPYAMYVVTDTAKDVAQSGNVETSTTTYSCAPAPSTSAAVSLSNSVYIEQGLLYPEQEQRRRQQDDATNAMTLACQPSPPIDELPGNIPQATGSPEDYDLPSDGSDMVLLTDPTSIYFASMGSLEQLFSPHDLSRVDQGASRVTQRHVLSS